LNKRPLTFAWGGTAVRRSERGFSVFKLLLVLAVAGFLGLNGALIGNAYYVNSKAQHCFNLLAQSMPTASVPEARAKLDDLFRLQYLYKEDLPSEFYDALQIKATGDMLEVSAHYSVTVWPFGKVADVDENDTYDPAALTGLDALRDQTRIDLTFEPYAISNADNSDAR
jgi:hypothetical protein